MTGITMPRLTVLPRLGQQAQEGAELALPHVTELLPVESLDLPVERRQEIEALPGDAGDDHPAVFPAPRALHQPHLLQSIQEPSGIGHLENQPLPHLVPPEAIRLGSPKDPEHVVLGGGEPMVPEKVGCRILEHGRRARQAHRGLLLEGAERLPLLELRLDAPRHAVYVGVETHSVKRPVFSSGRDRLPFRS
jgi:hypothetical protein